MTISRVVCSVFINKEKTLTDLRLSIVKPLGAKWMVDLYNYIKQKPKIVHNGFKEASNSHWLFGKLSM